MSVRENLETVQAEIREAAGRYARDPEDISLVAISKVHTADTIRPALEAGHRIFGENRVQEAQSKWPALREDFPGLELHLVGGLQTNKAADAVALFDVIQTVDRPKLAKVLASEITKQNRIVRCLVQVNTGAEDQKGGVLPHETDDLVGYCRDDLGLTVEGLMCIPPVDEEPALHFALLGEIAKRNGLSKLSMGMSADFETAIQFGANWVRVGTAVFGERSKPSKA